MLLSESIERIRTLAADPESGPEGRRETKHSNEAILVEIQRALQELTRTIPEAFYYKTLDPNWGTSQGHGKTATQLIRELSLDADPNVPIGEAWLGEMETKALASLEAKDAAGTRPVVTQQLAQQVANTTADL